MALEGNVHRRIPARIMGVLLVSVHHFSGPKQGSAQGAESDHSPMAPPIVIQ